MYKSVCENLILYVKPTYEIPCVCSLKTKHTTYFRKHNIALQTSY